MMVKFSRVWAMPSRHTFTIKPIAELLGREVNGTGVWVDPFAGYHSPAHITNDINPETPASCHMDALSFLRNFDDNSVYGVLFDPPYSPRQLSECYKSVGVSVNNETTQSKFWGDLKKEISRVIQQGGKCITFGWNSGGIGVNLGFSISEILLVPHGGWHNDTIVTVEVKAE